MTSLRLILSTPFRATATAVLVALRGLQVAWAVLRFALAAGLLVWAAVAVWTVWHSGRTDHLIAVLLILIVCGSIRRGASPRWHFGGGPAGWHREGMRARLHE